MPEGVVEIVGLDAALHQVVGVDHQVLADDVEAAIAFETAHGYVDAFAGQHAELGEDGGAADVVVVFGQTHFFVEAVVGIMNRFLDEDAEARRVLVDELHRDHVRVVCGMHDLVDRLTSDRNRQAGGQVELSAVELRYFLFEPVVSGQNDIGVEEQDQVSFGVFGASVPALARMVSPIDDPSPKGGGDFARPIGRMVIGDYDLVIDKRLAADARQERRQPAFFVVGRDDD